MALSNETSEQIAAVLVVVAGFAAVFAAIPLSITRQLARMKMRRDWRPDHTFDRHVKVLRIACVWVAILCSLSLLVIWLVKGHLWLPTDVSG